MLDGKHTNLGLTLKFTAEWSLLAVGIDAKSHHQREIRADPVHFRGKQIDLKDGHCIV